MKLRLVALIFFFATALARAADPVVLTGRALGTTWAVKFLQPLPPLNPATLQTRVTETLERLEQQFSTYRPNSELSRFNAARSIEWITVSPELAHVAASSRTLSTLTGGAFDATVYPLVQLWGFGPQRRSGPPPAAVEIATARARVDYRQLEIRRSPPALRKTSPDLAADFSSMAKGFATDTVSALLTSLGSANHYVQLGGDIATAGSRVWPVAIEAPLTSESATPSSTSVPTIAQTLSLAGQSLSTSGDGRNFFEHSGRRYGHILDPRTGAPVTSALASVSVVAPTCAESSARATALFVLGPEAGFDLAVRENWPALFLIREGPSLTPRPTPEFARIAR